MSNLTDSNITCVDELKFDGTNIADSVFMFLLFGGLGAACNANDIRNVFIQPKAISIIILGQYLIMPLLAYLMGMAADMSAEFKIAFIISLAAPGGALSNMIAVVYQGDVPLSVGVTGFSCLLGIGLMPLNQYVYVVAGGMLPEGSPVCVKFLGIFWSALVVVVAISVGVALKSAAQRYKRFGVIKATYYLGALGGVGIGIQGIINNMQSTQPWWQLPPIYVVCIIVPVFVGPTLAWLVGTALSIPGPSRLILLLEVGIQNMPISMAAIGFVLDRESASRAIALPVCYQIVATVYLIIFSFVAWKKGYTNLDPNKSFIAAWREGRRAQEARRIQDIYGDDAQAKQIESGAVVAVAAASQGSQSAIDQVETGTQAKPL